MTNMTVEHLPTYRIAYVRQVGPYGPANAEAMEKLKEWAMERELLTTSAILFGIPQDNPAATPPENCRYDACIVISEDYEIAGSINESELVGGTYAICKIKHTAEEVQRAWSEVLPFIQSKGYQMDNRPVIERYTGEMITNHSCEICIPIIA
ncbi:MULTISPECIES: GyrI-like domain-containing protein [Paenibacillus]|uniref:AraC family transcriptional regulator n=1 Tax=Paenibacillus TaxID=44249 RepID=UPI0011A448E7|nr:GyrI-like domain-containing protein [Paenibacillus lactis]GIO92018.1 DNA gyrase inhibitor [Paenibacillus lactis]